MHDAGAVGVAQRLGHLGRGLGGQRQRHRSQASHEGAEVPTRGVLGGDERQAVLDAVVEDLDDVGRLEAGQGGGLALEAVDESR